MDSHKTKAQLISEVLELRCRIAELEKEAEERLEAEKKLRDYEDLVSRQACGELERRKLTMAIEHSVNLVFITDKKGTIEYLNPVCEQVTGWTKEEAIGKNPNIMASGETPGEQYKDLWETVLAGKTWRGLFKNKKKGGEPYWVNAVVSPIADDKGDITHFLAVQEDITGRRKAEEKIQFLEYYDPCTGLFNRSRFIECLNDWICGPGADNGRGALLLLDIDHFKLISDTYGHGMGDEFLRRVAKMLQITMRYVNSQYFNDEGKTNVIARLSGDEFSIFLPSVERAGAVAAAEQIRKGLEGFYHADASCHLTVSMGISLFPGHGSTTTELLTRADAAMYRAKELGRNRFHVYSPEDRSIEQMRSRLVWKENILNAIRNDKFEPWYQPIKSLKMDKVMHYEVLARMRGADGGIILPGPFIDIAERFGLVAQISKVIIDKAMRFLKKLNLRGRHPAFCINVSGKQLGDSEFLYFLQSKIDETGLDPGRIIFEITETSSISEIDKSVRFLRALKNKGCHIALDDFGIGFTSFMYLKELNVDYIKIAGPFIKNLDKNLNDRLFVKAMVDVAKGMNIQTIAEFVEREETVNLLKEIGIDYAQGYLIGKPSSQIDHSAGEEEAR